MAITPRKTKGGIVYWVITRGHAERVGKDKREADRLDAQRKRELKAGTFAPANSGSVSVATFLAGWLDSRKTRSARIDRSVIEHHVLTAGRAWFGRLRMQYVEPRHVQRLVDEIKASGALAPKSVANVFGSLRTAFRLAVRRGIIARDVCLLDPGTISKKPVSGRVPYSLDEARTLLATATLGRRAWVALALFTGMRCGEVCGRRWRDWDPKATPLGALTIGTQYADEPLKTDSPRRAPVHPELAVVLAAWKLEWELVYLRKPTQHDFIVPRLDAPDRPLSNSSAYKAWAKHCASAGVPNRTQHATRHTFLTEARRGGADRDVIERVTHNAENTMVDHYTHPAWDPLCAAVLCFPFLDATLEREWRSAKNKVALAPAVGLEDTQPHNNQRNTQKLSEYAVTTDTGISAVPGGSGAELEAAPESERGPGIARCHPSAWALAFAARSLLVPLTAQHGRRT